MAQDVFPPTADLRPLLQRETSRFEDIMPDAVHFPDLRRNGRPRAAHRPTPRPDGRRKTVLVMDGAPDILALVQQILEDDGYRVVASTRLLAPEVVRALDPDLIVLELLFDHQPAGWAFVAGARRTPGLRQAPILLLTAAPEQTEPRALELTARGVDVLAKPFNIDALLATVRARLADPPPLRLVRGHDAD